MRNRGRLGLLSACLLAGGLLAFLGVALIFKMPELVLLKQMLTERMRRR